MKRLRSSGITGLPLAKPTDLFKIASAVRAAKEIHGSGINGAVHPPPQPKCQTRREVSPAAQVGLEMASIGSGLGFEVILIAQKRRFLQSFGLETPKKCPKSKIILKSVLLL
ncbi:MAG TPA: hypothetical protein VMU48_04615 [Terracidiphilus sp.]|nr:hypothetical protein [Terracidiphilus sp.]